MTDIRARRRPATVLRRSMLGGILLVAATLSFSAAPALAHNSVVGTTPEAGSVVTEQPGAVVVTTNDNLLDLSGQGESSAMQVSGPAAAPRYYGDGCATVSGPSLTAEVQLGQPGEYTVVWQTVSTDGHSISDRFTFTWQPDANQVLDEGTATAPACDSAGTGGDQAADTDAAATAEETESAGSGVAVTDLLWIGGAVVAILAAIGVTLLFLRKRPTG
ncbi:copper resistance protein CopC [Cryobacterium sp. 1639]|uniref:copper resistance CopC family protein n=1 Tax=Cryobacterium inferilacus TaxID=2866629 RepID=UPI001C737A4B|nr:copper resistance CopC family protein [Cryobacterium sp. 1639]MBX0299485.1 copper resistance protein CopC [Cryobacterium sp. 1639]